MPDKLHHLAASVVPPGRSEYLRDGEDSALDAPQKPQQERARAASPESDLQAPVVLPVIARLRKLSAKWRTPSHIDRDDCRIADGAFRVCADEVDAVLAACPGESPEVNALRDLNARLQMKMSVNADDAALRIEHARKQGAADGFQAGWHGALKRIAEGDDPKELADIVPGAALAGEKLEKLIETHARRAVLQVQEQHDGYQPTPDQMNLLRNFRHILGEFEAALALREGRREQEK